MQPLLDHGFLFGGEADLFGAPAGIADGQDPDQVAGSAGADGTAGAMADAAMEQGAAEDPGGGGQGGGELFSSYVLSFIYVGIYWNNHHHLFHTTRRVSAGILWSNLHLLFWLSLFPFATAWMGENHVAPAPTAVYGIILPSAAISSLPFSGWFQTAESNELCKLRSMPARNRGDLLLRTFKLSCPAVRVDVLNQSI